MIDTIVPALETIIQNVTSFTKMHHYIDIQKNINTTLEKRFSVRPLDIKEIAGTTQAITYMQDFQVTLCDKYVHENINDIKKRTKVTDLMEKWKAVYKEGMKNRFYVPEILSCKFARVNKPVIDEDSKTIILVGTMTLLYRENL